MRWRGGLVVGALVLLATACGGSTSTDSTGTSADVGGAAGAAGASNPAGQAGSAGSAGSTVTAGSAGSAGGTVTAGSAGVAGGGSVGGSSGGSNAGGASAVCEAGVGLTLSLTDPDGATQSCQFVPSKTTTIAVEGVVTSVTSNLTIDVCKPSQGCAPKPTTLKIGTDVQAALTARLHAGDFVRITLVLNDQSFGFGCTSIATIHNLPTFDGASSPLGTQPFLLAEVAGAIMDGASFYSELGVARAPFGCKAASKCPGSEGEAYRLVFGKSTSVGIGESAKHVHQGRSYQVKVLDAFESGCPDDYWRYSYWAVGEP